MNYLSALFLAVFNFQQQFKKVNRLTHIFRPVLLAVTGHVFDHGRFTVMEPVSLAVFHWLNWKILVMAPSHLDL